MIITTAIAKMQKVAIATPPAMAQRNVSSGIYDIPSAGPMTLSRLPDPVRFYLLAISLFTRLDCVVQRISLLVDNVAALLDNVGCHTARIFAQIRRLLFQEFLAFIGLA